MRLLLLLFGLLVASGLAHAQQMSPFPSFDGTLPVEEGELPNPEEAFKPTASVRNGATVVVQFSPVSGYYLYRDRISVSVANDNETSVANIELPPGALKKDPSYGDTLVFDQPFSMVVNLARTSDLPTKLTLQVSYLGCKHNGIRYPPTHKIFDLLLPRRN